MSRSVTHGGQFQVSSSILSFFSSSSSSPTSSYHIHSLSLTASALSSLNAMSKDYDHGRREPSPWAGNQHPSNTPPPSGLSSDPGSPKPQNFHPQLSNQFRSPAFTPSSNPSRPPDRPKVPTRSSTLGNSVPDHNLSVNTYIPQSRSEDLNHGSSSGFHPSAFPGSSPRPSPAFLTSASGSSRPSTPGGSQRPKHPSSSGHSEELDHRRSVASFSSANSNSSSNSGVGKPPPTTASSTSAMASTSASLSMT